MTYVPPKYTPNTAAGQTRRRIWRVGAENPNALETTALPHMTFHEENAVSLEETFTTGPFAGKNKEASLVKLSGSLRLAYDPAEVILTRNPSTDALGPVGRIPADLTMAECLAVIYGLGRHAQTKRDEEAAAAAAAAAEQQE